MRRTARVGILPFEYPLFALGGTSLAPEQSANMSMAAHSPRGVPRHETANETEPIVLPAFIPTICRPSTSPVGVEPQRDPSNRCR